MALTFDAENRAQMRALHAEGKSCRQIAAIMGFSAPTISKYAREEGLSFDRAQTAAATKAHAIDLAAARTALAGRMVALANEVLDTANDRYLVYSFGGKENDYNEHELEEPPMEAKRSMMTIAAIAFDKVTRIVERESGAVSEAVSVVDRLMDAIDRAAGETPVQVQDAE